MAIQTPQKCLRWRTIYANSTPRARTRHPVPTQAGGMAMIRTATLAALAALLAAPAMAACPAITSDTDPCWEAQVIQSEKGRPAAADEWTPESFARTFGQTIVSLTDAGQSMHHYCNPTFCEEVITDGKISVSRHQRRQARFVVRLLRRPRQSRDSQMFVQRRRENPRNPSLP